VVEEHRVAAAVAGLGDYKDGRGLLERLDHHRRDLGWQRHIELRQQQDQQEDRQYEPDEAHVSSLEDERPTRGSAVHDVP